MTDANHSFDDHVSLPPPAARLGHDFAMPLAVIGMLVLLSLIFCVHIGVSALNQQSAAREQQLVRNGLALRVEEVANLVVPQVDWDDAVRYLDNRYDAAWADSNINQFLNHTYGFDAEFVIAADDRPIFAAVDGDVAAVGEYHRIAGHAADLLRSIRTQEVARGPLHKTGGSEPISKATAWSFGSPSK